MTGTLDGIRVVELTTVVLGPWASQMLGDMGADVIKIETPKGDISRQLGPRRNEGMASLHLALNRNKRSIVLDLNSSIGQDILFKIVKSADVFVHNLRPKVAAKLGIGYAAFEKLQPSLIYCATYGFRREGPMADLPAYDDIVQAACGHADLQGAITDQPRYVPTVMADKTTAYNVVSAILAALFSRERGGSGQEIEVPMFESLVDFVMVEHLSGATFDPPIGPMGYARILNKERKPYATLDGFLSVLPYTDENWRALFQISGRNELFNDPRFINLSERVKYSESIYATLAEIISTRSSADWQRELEAANVPVMPVSTKEMLLTDIQLMASGFWRMVEHPTEGRLRMTDPPIRFSKTPSTVRRMAPRLGEHSAEILAEIGFNEQEISLLFEKNVSRTTI